jgi:hypothetical protein
LSDNVEQVLATSGELDLVVVAGNEIAHFYAYDGSERRLFGRSKTMKVSSSKRLPESYVGLAAKTTSCCLTTRCETNSASQL